VRRRSNAVSSRPVECLCFIAESEEPAPLPAPFIICVLESALQFGTRPHMQAPALGWRRLRIKCTAREYEACMQRLRDAPDRMTGQVPIDRQCIRNRWIHRADAHQGTAKSLSIRTTIILTQRASFRALTTGSAACESHERTIISEGKSGLGLVELGESDAA